MDNTDDDADLDDQVEVQDVPTAVWEGPGSTGGSAEWKS